MNCRATWRTLTARQFFPSERPSNTGHISAPGWTSFWRIGLNGVTGKPSLASAEQGRELFGWMVEDLAAIVERGKSERPPLDQSYFDPL